MDDLLFDPPPFAADCMSDIDKCVYSNIMQRASILHGMGNYQASQRELDWAHEYAMQCFKNSANRKRMAQAKQDILLAAQEGDILLVEELLDNLEMEQT